MEKKRYNITQQKTQEENYKIFITEKPVTDYPVHAQL